MTSRSRRRPRAELILERWIRDRIGSTTGETLEQYTARCDLGEGPGLEPGVELEILWQERD